MSTVETSFKVNYPRGFFNLNCRPKKEYVDRTNLQYTGVSGLEEFFDTIDAMLSVYIRRNNLLLLSPSPQRNLKVMVIVWVIILLGAGITIPLMIIYELNNLWMSWFFPAFVRKILNPVPEKCSSCYSSCSLGSTPPG